MPLIFEKGTSLKSLSNAKDVIFNRIDIPKGYIRPSEQKLTLFCGEDTKETDLLKATHIYVPNEEFLYRIAKNVRDLITAKVISSEREIKIKKDPRKRILFILTSGDMRKSITRCLLHLVDAIREEVNVFVLTGRKDLGTAKILRLSTRKDTSDVFRANVGDATFDVCINYRIMAGKLSHDLCMFSRAPIKAVYLHNDMRFLSPHFSLVEKYDKVLTVSKAINDIHKDLYGNHISLDRILSAPNICPGGEKEKMSLEAIDPLEEERFFSKKTFITIGRLHKQKNHKMLIEAFSSLSDCSLLILGEGEQRDSLEKWITEKDLQGSVFMLGFKDNPYKYLRRADCFILSSKYEGQGLVILESLIIGTPVISVDIPSAREILLDGERGKLCDNSIDGLRNAMEEFLISPPKHVEFNIDEHNERNANDFISAIEC